MSMKDMLFLKFMNYKRVI